jgi:diguanylate cyclase (GGDEF)-like protein
LTVALLDIDHFKQVNDTCGHSAGDRALQLFANCVSQTLRGVDRLGRYGGEEFLVVLVTTSLSNAGDPLERIRSGVADCDWSAIGADIRLTLTIGATEYARGESAENLMRRADLALYLGKEAGRDRVVLSRPPKKRSEAA